MLVVVVVVVVVVVAVGPELFHKPTSSRPSRSRGLCAGLEALRRTCSHNGSTKGAWDTRPWRAPDQSHKRQWRYG